MKRKLFYEEHFGRADEELRLHSPAKKVLDIIRKKRIKAKTLLDLGCGDGAITIKLSQALQSEDVWGVDISDKALEIAAKNGIKVVKVNLDEEKLPFPDASFDFVYCGEIIEHLTDPDHLLDEVYRVLKHHGLFVVTTPNLAGWVNRILLLFGYQPFQTEVSYRYDVGKPHLMRRKEMAGHLRVFTARSLKELLMKHGFSDIKVYGAYIEYLPSIIFKPVQLLDHLLSLYPNFSMHSVAICKK